LPNMIMAYPTPGITGLSNGTGNCEKANLLYEEGKVTEEERRSMRAGNGGRLNPDWIELLMGWPKGWTDIDYPCRMKFRDWDENWEQDTPRIKDDVQRRKDRIKAIGNGQVPQTAVLAFVTMLRIISEVK